MATRVSNVGTVIPRGDTVAHFKSYAQPVSDALTSLGWAIAYSSTGSSAVVNWSGVGAVPASPGTIWETWGMAAGTPQTNLPFYMRIDYYNDGNPKVDLKVGRSHTSGVIDAANSNGETLTFANSEAGNNTGYSHYFSGNGNCFRWLSTPDYSSSCFYFTVERLKDNTGADTYGANDGVWCGCAGANVPSNYKHMILPSSGTPPASINSFSNMHWAGTSLQQGTDIAILPIIPVFHTARGPLIGTGLISNQNFVTDLQQISVTTYGSSRTFITSLHNNMQYVGSNVNTSYSRLAMLWDASFGG